MVSADIKVMYDWGGSDNTPGTSYNVTDGAGSIRFKNADDDVIDANNPIQVPTTGKTYSFWKQIYLKCTNIQDATQIDNLKFYGDGAVFGGFAGVDMEVGDELPVKNSGADTGYDVADAGTIMTIHTDITGTTNATTKTSGSPFTVTISEAGNIINATNETSNYVVLQLRVGSTADSGTLTAETLTFSYDEV